MHVIDMKITWVSLSDWIVEPDQKTRQRKKRIGCFFVGGDILLAAFVGIAFCFVFFFVEKKNATQRTGTGV